MSDASERIEEWVRELETHGPVPWDRLPEIYLYMDQVLTYLNKQLSLYEREDSEAVLTSSMINNYVKDGVLKRPEQKKYSREHLAILTVICMLKPVLSLPDITVLLKNFLESSSHNVLYENFCSAQSAAFQEVGKRVAEAAEKGEPELNKLAVELSVEANARRSAAERILSELSRQDKEKKS